MKMAPSKEWTMHLHEHIDKWPATKEEIVAACSNMADVSEEEKRFVMEKLPDGTYDKPQDVTMTLEQAMEEKEGGMQQEM